jgi:Conjugal transfer protein TraD
MAKNAAARRRAEAGQRRFDTREWVVKRRERTRHLIELGGLVQKSGLVELAGDDRATLYGAMLDAAGRAGDGDGANALVLWKRRGKRAFDAEEEANVEAKASAFAAGGET